jgi:dihydrofolate synthase/folylpolyglutamate synthase
MCIRDSILGNTISDIAFEKAGIIKRNVPVFIAEMEKSAENRIINIARERGAPLYLLKRFWNKVKREINVNGRSFCIKRTGLKGSHQMENAALALITLFSVTDLHDDKKIVMGLDNVVNNSGIQGRYEFIGPFRNIIFDAAHNLDGIKIFLQEFKREYKKYQNRTLIFGAMKDKDIAKMLELLNPYFDRIIITSVNNERAASVSEITVIAENSGIRTENGIELKKIIVDHLEERPEDCLTVLGSIYLLGEIKKTILSQI